MAGGAADQPTRTKDGVVEALTLRSVRSTRLEGRGQARRLWPSFETAAVRPPQDEGPSLQFIFVCAVGLLAGAISGIIGTGSSIMLVPVLVWQFGPKEAVPIMAVAAIMGNFSRILAWLR